MGWMGYNVMNGGDEVTVELVLTSIKKTYFHSAK